MYNYITDEQIEMIRSMSEKRIEQKVIAEQLGISTPTVRRYQKKFGLLASNRFNGGVVSQSIRDTTVDFKKDEQRNGEWEDKHPREWCMLAEKTCTLVGIDTGYMYTIGSNDDHVKITTNNSEDIIISLKQLVAFGNEILDVAESVQKLKNNRTEI